MRLRWFGEPWPSTGQRAGICDSEEYRVLTPVGKTCVGCEEPIVEGERGIVMAATEGVPHAFWTTIAERNHASQRFVCAEHVDCFVRGVMGPDFPVQIERVPS